MKALALIVVFAACNSAVVNVERTSSGAVERDVDFTPDTGYDHHYVFLPAYPLANCTDTLVYDRLIADAYQAMLYSGVVAELSEDDMTLMSYIAEVAHAFLTNSLGDLKSIPLSASFTPDAAASAFKLIADVKKSNDEARKKFEALKSRRTYYNRLRSAQAFARKIYEARKHLTPSNLTTLTKVVAHDPQTTGLLPAETFDALVNLATTGRFEQEDLRRVPISYKDSKDPEADKAHFEDAAADFARLAGAFGATPCTDSQSYRYFYGYDPGEASWVDRDAKTQLDTLSRLATDLGVNIDGKWPETRFAFLHFSDVQIREPGAKLGGEKVSHDLREIESSFEQDYTQEQFAMFVYEGIVETARAEWCLYAPAGDQSCEPYRNESVAKGHNRVAPSVMINTGDSADMGLQSEFDTFSTYTNKLPVPWYQALGNHDVLAFGNLKMSSRDADRPKDDNCNGWGSVPCTCTNVSTLVREEVGRTPDNRGATRDDLPSKGFTAAPMLLKRICLLHAVASDWFVMDPDKLPGGNPVLSFVLSQCSAWHPKPGAWRAHDAKDVKLEPDGSVHVTSDRFDQPELAQCVAEHAGEYAVRPPQGIGSDRCAVSPAEAGESGATHSGLHGFDLGPAFNKLPLNPQARDLGYYCVQLGRVNAKDSKDSRRIWGVVLNTNTDAGAYGVFPVVEQNWLAKLLPDEDKCRTNPDAAPEGGPEMEAQHGAKIGCKDLVMVFAHHPVYGLYDQQERIALTNLLTESSNVVGMFIGHHHRSGLRVIRPLRGDGAHVGGHAKWEVMGPSVIDYPQAAREITMHVDGELGYFDVLTFSPHGHGKTVDYIRQAEAGAIRDKCHDKTHCPDGDGRIRLPAREITYPRLFFRMPHWSPPPAEKPSP